MTHARHLIPLLVILLPAAAIWAGPKEDFEKQIQPLLKKYCHDCHNDKKSKGDLNLARFTDFEKVLAARDLWMDIKERVVAYEMPPKKAPQLNYGEHERFRNWFRRLPKPQLDCNTIATDGNTHFYRGFVMSRRLNRDEYNNTVRDLTGLDLKAADDFPADGSGGEGFDNVGDTLFTSPILLEKYLDAADRIARTLLPDRAQNLPADVAEARKRLLIAAPDANTAPREAARRILAAFARRAFRRPVKPEEVDRLLTMFDRARKRGDDFEASLRLSLKAVLISPHFLFLVEPDPAEGGVYELGPLPKASRLSYFLWASMPDETLLKLAESGELAREDVYRAQIRRMLADPKAEALGRHFAIQWLEFRPLGTSVKPDAERFPQFDDELADAMRAEMIHVFNHVIRNDRPLLELLDADYSFVNERLAKIYGLPDVRGSEMRLVKFTDRHRGGILGMAGVHTLTSYPLRTSPVLRGKWILETLLGGKIPPPPPDVPALEEDEKKVAHVSLRKQLEEHRAKAQCASCHNRMDPLGFGLENFDVLGRWRDTDRGQPIDASGKLPTGESFNSPAELKKILLQRKDKVMGHFVEKLTGYAYARGLNKFDRCTIDEGVKLLQKNGYRPHDLLEHLASSYPFLHRYSKKD